MPAARPNAAALDALKAVVGPAGYLDAPADIAPFLVDFRERYHGRSPLVLLPASTDEVARIARLCYEHDIGLVPHGGNTSYCGGATPDESGTQIVLALRRMNRVRSADAANFTLVAEAGCVLADVQAAADRIDRLFPLSLGSEGTCQIGGNIATNAGGTAVLRYGMMRDLVLGLEVVLADGRVLDSLRTLRKDNSGYDLKQLFIGSEGTLGIVTAAALKLFPKPAEFATAFCAVSSPAAALALLADMRAAAGETLTTFELVPRIAIDLTTRHIPGIRDPLPERHPWYVLIELSAANPEAGVATAMENALAHAAERGVVRDAALAANLQQRESMWRLRESIPEAQRRAGASLKHDISVPVAAIPEFIDRTGAWIAEHVADGELIAYGHLGDGNLHFNVQQKPGADPEKFLARAETVRRAVHDRVAEAGGSFSAEHGIGRAKLGELYRYKSAVEIELMRSLKTLLDPRGILNPGKLPGANEEKRS